jgi:hypothetical protein
MAKWDKMTRQAWEQSVVAKEFEKHIIGLAQKLEVIAQSTTSTISDKGKQIQESLTGATDSVEKLTDAAKNLNEDGESEDDDSEKKAQESLIDDLNAAAIAAANMGNIKLAYRIERTISELIGE